MTRRNGRVGLGSDSVNVNVATDLPRTRLSEPAERRRAQRLRRKTRLMEGGASDEGSSAVAPNVAARCQANQHGTATRHATCTLCCILKPPAQTKHTLPGRHAPGSMEKITPGIAVDLTAPQPNRRIIAKCPCKRQGRGFENFGTES